MILRILRFTLVLVALVAALLSEPHILLGSTTELKSNELGVSAKDLSITCTGSTFLAGGKSGTSVSSFRRVGKSSISSSFGAPSGSKLLSFSGSSVLGYGVRQDLVAKLKTFGSTKIIDSTGTLKQGSALLTANQLQLATSKQLKGLLGAPCLRAKSEFWLVGGSVATGREALLVLTNPGDVDASVDLEIFTEAGLAHSAGLTGISVPAGRVEVLPLAGYVLAAKSITLHVKSNGGSVTALIQQKAVRGLSASGADYIAPVQATATDIVLPGILVRGAADSASMRSEDDKYSDVQQMLRVFVPGNKDAELVFQVLGTDSKTFGTVLSVMAPAGKVSDFKIKGLADGDYVGFLKSSVPVLSSFRLVRSKMASDRFTDFAWINAAETFDLPRAIAIPKAGISKLSLVNPGSVTTQVSLTTGSQKTIVKIPAGAEIVVRPESGKSVLISPNGESICANLVVDVSGRVAVLPVLDEKNLGGTVRVSVQ